MKQGIFARAGLSTAGAGGSSEALGDLQCHDSIEIKLNWGTLSNRPAVRDE